MEKRENTSQTIDFEKPDIAMIRREAKDVMGYISRQVFNQIPSVSAIAGIVVGAWIASTFTTSPIKGFLAEWGVIKGGTHVVSSGTYKVLSVFLPIVATGVTAYAVQKGLKAFRDMRLELNKSRVEKLDKEIQAELSSKLALLEKVRAAGILSESEFETKVCGLYQAYVKKYSKVEEMVVSKLTSKLQ